MAKFVKIKIEQVVALDKSDCGHEVVELIKSLRPVTFYHDDNVTKMTRLAERFCVDLEVMLSYVWLQLCVKELGETFEDVASPEMIAEQLGIEWQDFEEYFLCRAEELHNLLDVDEDYYQQLNLEFPAPWETEVDSEKK